MASSSHSAKEYSGGRIYPLGPSYMDPSRRPPGRKQVKNACTKCRKSGKKCDNARPCFRCVKLKMPEECVTIPREPRPRGVKRGPYRKKNSSDIDITSPLIDSEPECMDSSSPEESSLPVHNYALQSTGASSSRMQSLTRQTVQPHPHQSTLFSSSLLNNPVSEHAPAMVSAHFLPMAYNSGASLMPQRYDSGGEPSNAIRNYLHSDYHFSQRTQYPRYIRLPSPQHQPSAQYPAKLTMANIHDDNIAAPEKSE